MLDSITSVFSSISNTMQAIKAIMDIIKVRKGDARILLEEIKENMGLCWLVIEKNIDPIKIVSKLRTKEYDRLLRSNFNFNSLKRQKIKKYPNLNKSDLHTFVHRSTSELLENIYDKIKELKRIYRVDKKNPHIRWKKRVINLQKRILLLLKHLSE